MSGPRTHKHGDMFAGNIKRISIPIAALTSTTVVTSRVVNKHASPIRIIRAYLLADAVGSGAVAATIVVEKGTTVAAKATIGTISIADVSAVSVIDSVEAVLVSTDTTPADGIYDLTLLTANQMLIFSTTKASTVTFPSGTLVIEYVDTDSD